MSRMSANSSVSFESWVRHDWIRLHVKMRVVISYMWYSQRTLLILFVSFWTEYWCMQSGWSWRYRTNRLRRSLISSLGTVILLTSSTDDTSKFNRSWTRYVTRVTFPRYFVTRSVLISEQTFRSLFLSTMRLSVVDTLRQFSIPNSRSSERTNLPSDPSPRSCFLHSNDVSHHLHPSTVSPIHILWTIISSIPSD